MSSGDGLMISGMGGTIPLIAMRGGDPSKTTNASTTISGEPITISGEPSKNVMQTTTISGEPSKNVIKTTRISGENNTIVKDTSGITWEGTEYTVAETKRDWKDEDETNFLNFLGIPKAVFTSDDEYTEFVDGIKTCLNDSSSIDSSCESVNNILRRVIELRIQDLVEQKRYGNVQTVMNIISHKEDGSAEEIPPEEGSS
jgi:hypothetical protein